MTPFLAWIDAAAFDVIPALRWIAFGIAVPVAIWAVPGFLEFPRRPGVINGFRALAFLIAATSISFQSGYLFEGVPRPPIHPRTVLSLLFLVAALVVALGGLWIFRNLRRKKGLAEILEAIEATGPVADLWHVDPAAARKLAAEARRLTVDRVLERR